MSIKQKILVFSCLVLAASALGGVLKAPESAYAKSLSYTLSCNDGSVGLTVTKQSAKHQIVVRCKSGAKFTYTNNDTTAKNRVTGTCPKDENVGSDVDVPNGSSTRLVLYCVNISGNGDHAQATRTKNMPTAKTAEVKPKTDDGSGEDCAECALKDPVEGDDCGGVETAIIKCDAKNSGDTEDNGIWALLLLVLNIMTAGVGIIAVGGIVYGSILYTTAEDKADQVRQATNIITNVVIGLVLFALMYAGLNFIIPGGVFS